MYLCIHVYVCNSLTGQEVQGHPLTHQTVASGSPQLMDSCTFQDPVPSRGGWSDDEGGVADYGGEMSPLLTAPRKVCTYVQYLQYQVNILEPKECTLFAY